MNVLLINGSPRRNGNTHRALTEVAAALETEGVSTEIFSIGPKPVQGCTGCNQCGDLGRCVFKDELYETVRAKLAAADGLVLGSPTYYAGPNGSLCALLDRVFYSCGDILQYKPASAVAVCRRGGAIAVLDRLNKYFTISNMPIVPSQYWNLAYGAVPGEVEQDAEGLQTMRVLGRNMAWMLKNLNRDSVPEVAEERMWTNFVR
jgi:multimeric flavodoxin WrbA